MTEVVVPLGRRRPEGPVPAGSPTRPAPAAPSPGSRPGHHRPELLPLDAGEHYRFGFDMSSCIGCHSCEVACAEQNGLPAGTVWRRVGEIEGGDHPHTRRFHLSLSCNHCLDPACLNGCPTNAYEKLATGIVAHHADDCIGCRYCTWTCPYSVPAFQPDRRIVTKCDMCRPRLDEGHLPACVDACPTHAITVEKVRVDDWIADHSAADAPELPSSDLTISTTRIELPRDLPVETSAASDWNVRPEDPHWPLVWLTLVSQVALGVSLAVAPGGSTGQRLLAAGLAVAGMVGALGHLGRPVMAWKALRNLRRSWLSREVALLSAYAGLAVGAVLVPALAPAAAVAGVAGVVASACLYIVPGRPAWDTPLTIVRFLATALALGPPLTGHVAVGAVGGLVAVAATAANWARLARRPDHARRGAVRLELRWFAPATVIRLAATAVGVGVGLAGGPPVLVVAALVLGEGIGRWLFFVTVVPLNMPGSFFRGTTHLSSVTARWRGEGRRIPAGGRH